LASIDETDAFLYRNSSPTSDPNVLVPVSLVERWPKIKLSRQLVFGGELRPAYHLQLFYTACIIRCIFNLVKGYFFESLWVEGMAFCGYWRMCCEAPGTYSPPKPQPFFAFTVILLSSKSSLNTFHWLSSHSD